MAHQQVVARVHGAFPSQTPQLQGVGDRAVFGGARLALPIGINVLAVQDDRMRLNNGVTDFRQTDQRVAIVELTEVQDVESWARVVRRLDDGAVLGPGAQALLFDPGQGPGHPQSTGQAPPTLDHPAPARSCESFRPYPVIDLCLTLQNSTCRIPRPAPCWSTVCPTRRRRRSSSTAWPSSSASTPMAPASRG
jgi:hypothetical protein